MQKYRFAGLVVEVERIGGSNEIVGNHIVPEGKYRCFVRGFGHGNPAPRETYFIDAPSSASAARSAINGYNRKHNKDDGK